MRQVYVFPDLYPGSTGISSAKPEMTASNLILLCSIFPLFWTLFAMYPLAQLHKYSTISRIFKNVLECGLDDS